MIERKRLTEYEKKSDFIFTPMGLKMGYRVNQLKQNSIFSGDPEIGCDLSKEFDCGGDGKMCIPLDRVCNGKNDCGNWADEPKDFCEVNECSQSLIHDTKQPLCDQQCIDLPIGYKCACKEGYELVGNSTCKGKDVKS